MDCLLGIIISTLTFRAYHLAVKTSAERTSLSSRFILWLEGMQILPGSMTTPVSLTTGPSLEEIEALQLPLVALELMETPASSQRKSQLIAVPGEVSEGGFIPFALPERLQDRLPRSDDSKSADK